MTTIIGIDPGLKGAIAIMCEENVAIPSATLVSASRSGRGVYIYDMPIRRLSKNKTRIDMEKISEILNIYKREGDDMIAWIERPFVLPHVSRQSALTAGINFGLIIAALFNAKIPIREVHASEWQKTIKYGIKKGDKFASIEKARELYPAANLMRNGKPDHNRAEAVLIAEFGRIWDRK
jgi:Holliday junction resolvasome RuvABC endonuclease subunit